MPSNLSVVFSVFHLTCFYSSSKLSEWSMKVPEDYHQASLYEHVIQTKKFNHPNLFTCKLEEPFVYITETFMTHSCVLFEISILLNGIIDVVMLTFKYC